MPKKGSKNVSLPEDEASPRKASAGTIRSESGITHLHHTPSKPVEISEPLTPTRRPSVGSSMKVKHISPPSGVGSGSGGQGSSQQIRFPKLEEYAHFHYDLVEIPILKMAMCGEGDPCYKHCADAGEGDPMFMVQVTGSAPKSWLIRRTIDNFEMLDKQLHRCIFDRRFSNLEDLEASQLDKRPREEVQAILQSYLNHFSELAGGMVNCGSVLSWMEMDNRGHRLVATDDSGINTPAIAAAHVIKRYNAQAADEISLQVGDMISVIDMPPAEDTIWWRGKRGFEVGFFPSECVEVIGDKVPSSMASRIPEPVATAAASRKPCETQGDQAATAPFTTSTSITTNSPSSSSLSSAISSSSFSALIQGSSSIGASTCVPTFPLPHPSDSADSSPSTLVHIEDLRDTPVMRKHGKLLSFLRTFFSHRPPRHQLKQSGIVKERVFGCDLGEHLLNSGHDVPTVLKSCTEIIEEYGIVHGIYRLSGITSNIQKLRLAFDEDRELDLTEDCYLQDIHSISSLLKMYFRELPNPLLTYQLYDKFADAVRDEDNRLLRIHDVVQQLPPPHYRTLEYLMRHLARVAAFGHETEMHSKNLAIVWAPNLLRSKELEAGGGAAALQGVGIQAVVTECLICYSEIIFSDKMPNYGTQENGSGKRPRPKSLAISTPTRLLSLEEARERAFMSHLAPSQKFIDVGGGPKNLPSKYHTVIDLPGHKKKVPSSAKENKPVTGKKTSVRSTRGSGSGVSNSAGGGGGWKSIFSKPRSGSVKKPRKGSAQEPVSLGPNQAKALTVEDVHNWKRNLRSAKSAESLFSLPTTTSQNSISSHTSRSNADTAAKQGSRGSPLAEKNSRGLIHLSHKRSLSSDASSALHNRYKKAHESPKPMRSPNVDDGNDDDLTTQRFIRGDSTRKALHRRVPSAPNTPRQDRRPDSDRRSSFSRGESTTSGSDEMDMSFEDFIYPKSEPDGEVNIDQAIKSRLHQVAEKSRAAKSNEELTSSPLKRGAMTPPKGRKKAKADSRAFAGHSEDDLSPSNLLKGHKVTRSSSDVSRHTDTSPYDNTEDRESRMRRFYSRFHDYAEILSDDENGIIATPSSQGTMSMSSSGCNMQDVLDQIDSRLAMTAKLFPRQGIGDQSGNSPESRSALVTRETSFSRSIETTVSSEKETEFSISGPPVSGGSAKETEFPATVDTSPRLLSSHSTVKELLGLSEDSQTQGNIKGTDASHETQSRTVTGSTEVGRRRVEISRTDRSSGKSRDGEPIYQRINKHSSAPSSTRVVRRQAEFIPSASTLASQTEIEDLNHLLESLENGAYSTELRKRTTGSSSSSPKAGTQTSSPHSRPGSSQSSNSRTQSPHHHANRAQMSARPVNSPSFDSKMAALGLKSSALGHIASPGSGMSKCLSVPSDIAKSLENVTESQSDMLSSVTISELSMSMNSFNNGVHDDRTPGRMNLLAVDDLRRRRSSSLDSLSDSDRLMTRTFREINRQMDAAFKRESTPEGTAEGSASHRTRERIQRLVSSDLDLSTNSEVNAAAKGYFSSNVPHHQDRTVKGGETQNAVLVNNESWQSSDSLVQVSDQSVTPTQAEGFSIAADLLRGSHQPESPLASRQEGRFRTETDRQDSRSTVRSGGVLSPDASNAPPYLDFPSESSPTLTNVTPEFSPDYLIQQQQLLQQPNYHHQQQQQPQPNHLRQKQFTFSNSSSMSTESEGGSSNQPREKQTHHQRDDQIVVETAHMVKSSTKGSKSPISKTYVSDTAFGRLGNVPHHHSTQHHHHHHSERAHGREDIALVYKKRSPSSSSSSSSVSSKSSEEFDEVASPEEDEPEVSNAVAAVDHVTFRDGRGGQNLLASGTGQVTTGEARMRENEGAVVPLQPRLSGLNIDVTATSEVQQVVRRQHSPRVNPRSPTSGSHGSPRSPRFDLDLGEGSPEASAIFQGDNCEVDAEATERMSSLWSVGLMSQRVRLSRESSTSSLQSPDSLHAAVSGAFQNPTGYVRSPLATPVQEALPDIVQSTTSTGTASNSQSQAQEGASNLPLQLALYHPDEFSMDISAAVSGPAPSIPPSQSLQQVHTSSELVTERKPTLRKSSTENAISEHSVAEGGDLRQLPPLPLRGASSSSLQEDASLPILSGNIQPQGPSNKEKTIENSRPSLRSLHDDVFSNEGFRHRASSDSLSKNRTTNALAFQDSGSSFQVDTSSVPFPGSPVRGINSAAPRARTQREEEEEEDAAAMEVDNLCNKLVDELTSPQSINPPTDFPTEDTYTVSASQDIRTDVDEQGTVSMEVETSLEVKGSELQSPVIRERRIIRSSSEDNQNVETRLVRIKGEMEEEEVQNVLNRGREILMSPDSTDATVPSVRVDSERIASRNLGPTVSHRGTGQANLDDTSTGKLDPGNRVRKTSFSKIPRPKASDSPHRSGAGYVSGPNGAAPKRQDSNSGLSSSGQGDVSPSSSSSSSSSARGASTSQSRRSSEAGVAGSKRGQGHSRRSSDTKVSDLRTDSPTTSRTQSRGDGTRSTASPRSRNSTGSSLSAVNHREVSDKTPPSEKQSSGDRSLGRSTRIPLSHRIPSPHQSDRALDSSSSLSPATSRTQASKVRSPIPKPRKSSSSSGASASVQSSNPDTAITSTADEVIEVTRPSLKADRPGRSVSDKSETLSGRKERETSGKKTVLVKDMPDKGGAKLVIETQPDLKKKIQTVHAKKVSQPPRQLAEALDSEGNVDEKLLEGQNAIGSTANSSSTSRSISEGHGPSSVTFSDQVSLHSPPEEFKERVANSTEAAIVAAASGKKTPPPVAKRKFRYDSKSLPRRSKNVNANHPTLEQFVDLIGSRSSLDDSVLQLAAERHDLLMPEGSEGNSLDHYSSGSLRVRRSLKMQSLMDLFERGGSDSNVSDSSGNSPGTRHRTYSASVVSSGTTLTPCMEVGRPDDDDAFFPDSHDYTPPSPRRRASSAEVQHLFERERDGTTYQSVAQRAWAETVIVDPLVSSSLRSPPGKSPGERSSERGSVTSPSSQRASYSSQQNVTSPTSPPTLRQGDPNLVSPPSTKHSSRPPRYRGTARTRTNSESLDLDSMLDNSSPRTSSHSRPSGMSASYSASVHDPLFPPTSLSSTHSDSLLRDGIPGPSVLQRTRHFSNEAVTGADRPADLVTLRSERLSSSGSSQANSHITPPSSPRRNPERRNSIKELRQVFEKADGSDPPLESTVTSAQISPSAERRAVLRSRVRSISPQPDVGEGQRERVNLMRLSLELPSSSAVVGDAKGQSVRLGPKPFYGTQK